MTTSPRKLRRSLVWYAFVVACLTVLLVGVLLTYQDGHLSRDSVFSSIGLNLIAAAIFAVIFSLLNNRLQDRSLEESLEDGLEELQRNLMAGLAANNQMFLPSATYPALDPGANFGDAYNRDLTLSLEQSSLFAFQGPSARFVAARLLKMRHYPQQIKVVMLDPSDRRAIARRASDRAHWPNSQGKSPGILEQELREELVVNIISLFDCRRICPVDILYHGDTAVYRYVMCDDALYVSWYHGPQSAGREMPESYRFDANSFFYRTARLDLLRKFEISDRVVKFQSTDDENVLCMHLAKLMDRPVDLGDLKRWRAAHAKQTAAFRRYLDELYKRIAANFTPRSE